MRDPSRHILFLATEYDAPGMRPYARNIINTMWQAGDHVLIVTRYGADNQAFPNIPASSITWIDYPESTWQRALFRYFPRQLNRSINRIIKTHGIDLAYSLTGELVLACSIGRMQRRIPLLYTVHDAVYHDYKFKSPLHWLKDRLIIALPQQSLFKHTPHKVTNSQAQLELIGRRYPGHKVDYVPFPTLVNEKIAQGGQQVAELKDVRDGYILFFGTVQLYKGVHLLYDAYIHHPELNASPLVVAGTGAAYFKRETADNAIFINRFMDDSELRDLFSRAAVVVYPYISATQSGVTSIASYFGKPMVLSDLPFFKQTCDGSEGVEFFSSGDSEALAAAIGRCLQSPSSSSGLYQRVYSPEALRTALEGAIGTILENQQ